MKYTRKIIRKNDEEVLTTMMNDINLKEIHHVPFEVFKKVEKETRELNDVDTESDEKENGFRHEQYDKDDFHRPPRVIDATKCNIRRRRNLPLEVTCRSSVTVPRAPLPGTTCVKARDPRFSKSCGEFKAEGFAKAYSFCDDMMVKEKQELKCLLKREGATLSSDACYHAKRRLDQLISLEQRRKRLTLERDVKKKLRLKETELIQKTGKKPFIPRKQQIKQLVKEKMYETLKKENKLDKYLARKDKKLKSKEMRYAPSTRRRLESLDHDEAL